VNQHPSSLKTRRTGSPRFWVLVAVGAVIAMFMLAVLVDSALFYNRVHAGVGVSGIDLGGKTKDEAIASVAGLVDEASNSPITLVAGDQTWTVMPGEVGTKMDVEGAVASAMAVTREHNIFTDIGTRWKLYFSHKDLPLGGTVDEAKLGTLVAGIAKELDILPVNAGLAVMNGEIKVIDSVDGRVVDQPGLADTLSALLLTLHSTTVEVPIVTKEPDVKAEDNLAAQKQAETMISGPVTVTGGDKEWTVAPDDIASYMGFRAEVKNGVSTLVPFMDATKLQPLLDEIAPAVLQKPTNASFDHNDTRAWVVPGKDGKQLDAEATAQAITAATLQPAGRTVEAVLKTKEPSLTTEEAKARGIQDKLSYCTTTYKCDSDRQTNVKLATKYGTNVFLAPGQEYNFDKQIGPRIAARGWHLAGGIVGAGKLEDVLGGGICQVSTTMFNAVADKKAGLKITERRNHSLYISHYPKGRDATVTDGGKNLRFVNDTDHYIWITGYSNGVSTTITVWGTDQGRSTKWTIGDFYGFIPMTKTTVLDPALMVGKTSLSQAGQKGQSLKTTRVVTQNGKVIHKDVWTNVWPMFPEETHVGTATTKPPTTTTTGPPPSTTTTTSTTEPQA
jgi:vancomycin resistance protein YoaR